jgi:hypothetical protein
MAQACGRWSGRSSRHNKIYLSFQENSSWNGRGLLFMDEVILLQFATGQNKKGMLKVPIHRR